jgi:hypothetical protein
MENTAYIFNEACLPIGCLTIDILLLSAGVLRRYVYRPVAYQRVDTSQYVGPQYVEPSVSRDDSDLVEPMKPFSIKLAFHILALAASTIIFLKVLPEELYLRMWSP